MIIFLVLFARLAAGAVPPKVCPRYIVKFGDSLASISSKYAYNLDSLYASIEACGQDPNNLLPGSTICLPGGELPSCRHVFDYLGLPECRYYVIQGGDSMAGVAMDLALYYPDLTAVNPEVDADNLTAGAPLRLPPWDTTVCGEELQDPQLGVQPPPPVASPPPPPTAPSRIERNPEDPAAVDLSTMPPTPPGTNSSSSAATMCRGYRMSAIDTLISVSEMFEVDFTLMMEANIDLAAGAPVSEGTIVRLPPYNSSCPNPVLVLDPKLTGYPPPAARGEEVREISAFSGSNSNNNSGSETGAPGPASSGEFDNSGSFPMEAMAPFPEDGTYELDLSLLDGPDDGEEVQSSAYISTNIVSDAASGYASPPSPRGPSAGVFIMGASIFFIVLAIFGVLGMTCSGAGKHTTSNKETAADAELRV